MRILRPPVLVTPGLSPDVWLLQAGVLLNFFGNGLVGPFLVIYLHFVRAIPLAVAGLAVGTGGVVATGSGILAGLFVDRFGARNTLVAAMSANAIAYASYTQVHAGWQAFLVGGAVGLGTGAYGPSVQTLLSSLVPAGQRPAAFSQQRMSAMVGLGLGAIIGGFIAAGGRPEDFELLLVLDAGTFSGFAFLLLRLPNPTARTAQVNGGYREPVRDRRLWVLAVVNLTMVSAGIAPMLVLLPAFAKVQAHVPATAIGLIFAVNTSVIVLAQLQVTQAVARRNPNARAGVWVSPLGRGMAPGARIGFPVPRVDRRGCHRAGHGPLCHRRVRVHGHRHADRGIDRTKRSARTLPCRHRFRLASRVRGRSCRRRILDRPRAAGPSCRGCGRLHPRDHHLAP